MPKAKRKQILEALQLQLAAKHAETDYYNDLLEDYMAMWDTKNKLEQDIKKRGVVYWGMSAAGKEMWKNNQSVKDLVMVNRQMLEILNKLKLSTDNASGGGDADDL
jgi:hypothetical protein